MPARSAPSDGLAEWRPALQPGGVLALAFHLGRQTVRVTELWGAAAPLDFSCCETGFVTQALAQAGFSLLSATEREAYALPESAQAMGQPAGLALGAPRAHAASSCRSTKGRMPPWR